MERCASAAEAQEAPAPNQQQILFAYVSADIYEYVEDCESFDAAIAKLKTIFIKPPNVIFARHLLATRKQQPGETLEDFYQSLHILSKDCGLRNVTAEEYRNELVRDAFINGLSSHSIRQRLLENDQLSVTQAFDNARSLRTAQDHSEAYLTKTEVAAILPQSSNDDRKMTVISVDSKMKENALGSTSRSSKTCYFCGQPFHQRKHCPALEVTCYSCGKRGHFSKVCRSRSPDKRKFANSRRGQVINSAAVDSKFTNLCTVSAACPASLTPASLQVLVNGTKVRALLDSGSSESYINSRKCSEMKLDVYPSAHQVQMAATAMKVKSTGFCLADVKIGESSYPSTRLNVLENLCSDIILGLDFQSQHQNLIIKFNGESPDLVVSPDSHCSLTAADVPKVSLFSNLLVDTKPIAARSRRFSQEDRKFIQETVNQLLDEGIIQPSSSPWRAQVVVVKDELNRHKKRMCVDYSQTINIYTELDAYPLPRIDDMINELAMYSFFSTFDLRSAYHQIEIVDSDCKFTAFEANGKLYEFKRIPFGVKNGVAAFQRAIMQFIESENLKGTYSYLDNVTVTGKTREEHDLNVKLFLEAIRRRNFALNDSKTIKSVDSIQILGYVVEKGIIKPDPERLRPLKDFPPPANFKMLKSVLGMFAYYAKWIDRFADKIRPLANAKVFPIDKDKNALKSFRLLKQELESAALHSIDESKPFVVECDASEFAVSATLNQNGRPVAFMSRTLQGSELHYPAIEKEATAIIEAIRKWSHFLLRNTFTLVTD